MICWIWSEQSASGLVRIEYDNVMFCPGMNFMYVWLYVFIGLMSYAMNFMNVEAL